MLRIATILLCFSFICNELNGQMANGTDTLYGNEWIRANQTYYKIKIVADGMYRINATTLSATDPQLAAVQGSQWRLYRYGEQVPIFVSSNAVFGTSDYIEFWGEKNRGQLDALLSDQPDQAMINPWYSLYTDTTAYFLTWETDTPPLRFALTNNNLLNAPAADAYVWQTDLQVFSEVHEKRRITNQVTFSWYNGEGFSKQRSLESTLSYTPADLYTNGPDSRIRVRFSTNIGAHQQQIFLHDSAYADLAFNEWRIIDTAFEVNNSRFNPGLPIRLKGIANSIDYHYWSGLEVRYPRQPNLGNNANEARFGVEPGDHYLELNGMNTGSGAPVAYDLTHRRRISTTLQGSTVRLRLPATDTQPSDVVLVNPTAGIQVIGQLQPIQFRQYTTETPADFIIISNSALFSDPKNGGTNHVEAYADYRRSAAGGGHQVAIVDVKELYEQFGFGAFSHPLAIRNFCHYIKKNWQIPNNLLFIGKGIEYPQMRKASNQVWTDSLHYVPMFGTPAVDLSYLMPAGKISKPIMAVGRLAVVEAFQIGDYLEKIMEHEAEQQQSAQTIADRAWMKRVIHISGGNAGETEVIKYFSENMGTTLRNNRFGADIRTYFKTSNDPIQTAAHEQIRDLVRDGVSLWMIYGHSSTFAVDYDIGAPSIYRNAPRYPYLMIMGCFTGTCALSQRGLGEDYILSPKTGVVAYSASSYYSFIDALHTYGNKFYERIGGGDYAGTVGEATQNTIGELSSSNYVQLVSLLHQNVYQGDPTLRLQVAPGPDYVIDNQTVTFNPNPVPTELPKYNVSFDVVNIGENRASPMAIEIKQEAPGLPLQTVLLDTIEAPGNRLHLDYELSNLITRPGFSRFYVTADARQQVAELPAAAELNNELTDGVGVPGQEIYFYSNSVQPVYPSAYGIVGKSSLKLIASASTNSVAEKATFRFELDTLETFNSPFVQRTEVSQAGGLLEWPLELTVPDSTVLYWRVSRDSLVDGSLPWRSSSFLYLKDSKPGWNQSHYGQYRNNNMGNLAAEDDVRAVNFVENANLMFVKVAYRNQNTYPTIVNNFPEGVGGDYGWNINYVGPGVALMMCHPSTGRMIPNPPNAPYNPMPAGQSTLVYYFKTSDSLARINLMNFIENEIPVGATVGLLGLNTATDQVGYAPELWADDSVSFGKNLFQVFEDQGAKYVRNLAAFTNVPPAYGFIFRKGDPNFEPIDTIVTDPLAFGELRRGYPARWFAGQMESQRIGPAHEWYSLNFRPGTADDPSDENVLTLWAEREGQADTLLLTLNSATYDVPLSNYPAEQFKYLKVRYSLLDTVDRTATPLDFVRILYEPVPEGALHPTAHYEFFSDTLEQGQTMRASIAFANISDAPFDTLKVKFRLENPQGGTNYWRTLRTLEKGDSLHVSFQLPTTNLSGPQRLLIDVNPDNDQPEQLHFNNVAFREFFVQRDHRNPLLDVTFDGSHLLNGDIVSPKPEVVITLKDDNRYLAMTDTGLFEVRLVRPDGSTKVLSVTDQEVQFFPADASNLPKKNYARIEWRPFLQQDGDYQLLVNGRDASGNESGSADYTIAFRVINKSSLSNLLNYPNPFSTSTCFYYTLTGLETPTHFRVQIMTVSGRIVREVDESEFGPLRAGTHQSTFCWDGRDQFGDQLANGVYLYRIVARKADGTPFELFENNSQDGYFKQGIGKMVLMR
jgi:Peptidase family C25